MLSFLVGGWTNPSEKYATVKLDHFPTNRGEHKKNELPPPSFVYVDNKKGEGWDLTYDLFCILVARFFGPKSPGVFFNVYFKKCGTSYPRHPGPRHATKPGVKVWLNTPKNTIHLRVRYSPESLGWNNVSPTFCQPQNSWLKITFQMATWVVNFSIFFWMVVDFSWKAETAWASRVFTNKPEFLVHESSKWWRNGGFCRVLWPQKVCMGLCPSGTTWRITPVAKWLITMVI